MDTPSQKESHIPRLAVENVPRLRTLIENFRGLMKHSVASSAGIANPPLRLLEAGQRMGGLRRAQSLSFAVHIGTVIAFVLLLQGVATHPPRIPSKIEGIFYPARITKEIQPVKP